MHYGRGTIERGYTNRVLRVDLAARSAAVRTLDPKVRDYFLGGRALGLYLLHRAVTAATRPEDPENPLIVANGPLGGIPQFPGAAKAMAVSLSPLTRIPGVSNFGGYFGAYLKYAGFDALEVVGKSAGRAMVVVDGLRGEVRIEEAPPGEEAFELEGEIARRFEAAGVDRRRIAFLSTGVGAAHTAYGCINSHYWDVTKPREGGRGIFRVKQAGRTGLGTVMRDKNLGAIVVVAESPRGENPYGAADWERARRAGGRLQKVVREVDPGSLQMARKGSAGLITFMNREEYQSLPVRNFQLGSDPRAGQICGRHYAEHLFDHRGMDGCFPGCNLQCTKGGCVTLRSGPHAGRRVWVDGPEYETAAGFGSNLGIWNPEFIMEANWHCDNYGIDTITTSCIMAFLMEALQRGYLEPGDGGGPALGWGDEPAALEFIHSLAHGSTEMARAAGRGIGELVAWVAARHRARTGEDALPELETFAMQTKGLPFSFYRTHRSLSMQASYAAASDIGAHHAAAWLIKADLLGAFPTFEDKARALVSYPRVRLGNDNMGVCKLPWVDVFNPESNARGEGDVNINPATQEIYAEYYNGVLGTELGWEEIFARTDRDINLQRVLNVLRYGEETSRHDWIPDRALGPTDDLLYEAEAAYNDGELAACCGLAPDRLAELPTAEKRERLMACRKERLRGLIAAYYRERGWSPEGVPLPETLSRLGLWEFLGEEARALLLRLAPQPVAAD